MTPTHEQAGHQRDRDAARATRLIVLGLLSVALLAGCTDGPDPEKPAPTGPTTPVGKPTGEPSTPTNEPTRDRNSPERTGTAKRAPQPTQVSRLPRTQPAPPGTPAPNSTAGPLRLTKVFVATTRSHYEVRANITNTGHEFLNDGQLTWTLRDADGTRLATGSTPINTLAPDETTSISSQGKRSADGKWSRISFKFTP